MSGSSDVERWDREISRAGNRRFEATVVFVHHFGGSRRTTVRHRKLVNKLGFDAVTFTLDYNHMNPLKELPISPDLNFGARYLWTDQIEAVLNSVPGPKIVYSFSMPSNSAIEAIARRHGEDILALVCDGGPFLQLPRAVWNLYQHEYKVESRPIRAALTGLGLLLLGPLANQDLDQKLRTIPQGFPVLSIRGTNDPLVPTLAIDEFLEHMPQVKLETLTINGGVHLDGLKHFADVYEPRVKEFLLRAGSTTSRQP